MERISDYPAAVVSGGSDPDGADVRRRAIEMLRDVVDPEVGLDVVELGLVYAVEVDGGRVTVKLTMTTPACPLGDQIVFDAEQRLRELDGVDEVRVDLVWDPPWTPDRMSARAREALGWEP